MSNYIDDIKSGTSRAGLYGRRSRWLNEMQAGQLVTRYPTGMDGFFGSVWGGVKDVAKGAASLYGSTQQQKGAMDAYKAQQAAQARQGMPGWILPVAIGGGALALVLLLKKRKR